MEQKLDKKLNEKELTEKEREELVDELKSLLRKGEVKFRFKKKDGSIRDARGTLKQDLLPKKERDDTRIKHPSDTCVCYYDLDKEDFRAFRKDSLLKIYDN